MNEMNDMEDIYRHPKHPFMICFIDVRQPVSFYRKGQLCN